jgi:hypothetical protein
MMQLVQRLYLWYLLLFLAVATTRTARAEILSLTPDEFHEIALTGEALIIDVRVVSAFVAGRRCIFVLYSYGRPPTRFSHQFVSLHTQGHIENTTYFRNFVSFLSVTPAEDINTTFKAVGMYPCLVHCTTIGEYSQPPTSIYYNYSMCVGYLTLVFSYFPVYCRSSAAAQAALDLLHDKAGFISARLYNGHGTTNWTDAGYPLVTGPSYRPPCMRGVSEDDSSEQFCPTTRNIPKDESNNPPDSTTPAVQQPKQAPDSKCGSIANEGGRGGSAAAAKDCSRNGDGLLRERKRIRGL